VNALLVGIIVLLGVTVWDGSGPPEPDSTIVISGERILEVGKNPRIPANATRIDLAGSWVTPGLVASATQLGLVEFATSEPTGIEGTLGRDDDEPVRAALLASDTFDPDDFAVPIARQQGITHALITPFGGVIAGQAAWVSLSPERDVKQRSAALVAYVRPSFGEAREGTRTRAFLRLREAFEDARLYRAPGNRGVFIRRGLRELAPSAQDLEVLARALDGDLKLIVAVDRASDILTVLELFDDQKLEGVLLGAAEGWRVASQIARAKVPVIVDPLANLPRDLDSLESRADNAKLLLDAGVEVAFSVDGPVTQLGRLRFAAGNAVAAGFPRDAALRAITRVPAEIFGRPEAGRIRKGASADLVVWTGDPFEPLQWAERAFIEGREIDLTTRQDRLTRRYLERLERRR